MFQAPPSQTAGTNPATTRQTATSPKLRQLRASSRAAYAKDLNLFLRAGGKVPADAMAVLRYAEVMRARLAPRTLYRRLMAIQHATVEAGYPSPLADSKLREMIRWLQAGKMPPKSAKALDAAVPPSRPRGSRCAKPVTRQLLDRILDAVHRTSLDRRDRALLLLTFAGGMKRSEVVALNVEDLQLTKDALLVSISARDGGQPRRLAIPVTGGELCAATAVRSYVEHLQLEPGTPLFRSFNRASEASTKRLAAAFVSEVLKARLKVVGVDPSGFSGESLRVGRLAELAKGVL
jgi:integrase